MNDNKYVIDLEGITKKYPNNSGVFDINLKIKKGEIFGFIGPNGAGKSTTIRQIVGFIKPDYGTSRVMGLDSWKDSKKIMENLGYIPGEPITPTGLKGIDFLKLCFDIRNLTEWRNVEDLIRYFQLDANKKIKKMSKGMKQKIMIIAAIMHSPDVLILDEPTSGLDPVMQAKFNNVMSKLKKNGTTVLISSHIFSEIQSVCDRFAMIKNGKIVSMHSMDELADTSDKKYKIVFKTQKEKESFKEYVGPVIEEESNSLVISIKKTEVSSFVKFLAKFDIENFTEIAHNLESEFRKLYGDEIDG